MFVGLSFIGKAPEYLKDCVHQLRLFFDGNICVIVDDLVSDIVCEVRDKYNVMVISYAQVASTEFIQFANSHARKFMYLPNLVGREQLFLRSFERFFLFRNLMKLTDARDGIFIEVDNLIYCDPREWISSMSTHPLCYMYDDENRFSAGVMYAKNSEAIEPLLQTINATIAAAKGNVSEMEALAAHYANNMETVQIIPTHPTDSRVPEVMCREYNRYGGKIFDSSSMGIYLCGFDPFHTNGIIKTGMKNPFSQTDYTCYQYDWKLDEKGRKVPHVMIGDAWIPINNLHIHSKNLRPYLSDA